MKLIIIYSKPNVEIINMFSNSTLYLSILRNSSGQLNYVTSALMDFNWLISQNLHISTKHKKIFNKIVFRLDGSLNKTNILKVVMFVV